MAECNLSQILVSGAGLELVNGTYIAAGTETQGALTSTVFTKDGDINSLPKVRVEWNQGPNTYYWEIKATIPDFGNQPIYSGYGPSVDVFFTSSTIPACPVGLDFEAVSGPWDSSLYEPAPTITAGGGSDPITLRNNKYATANEAGANRFRRLSSLGYV